MEPEKKQDSFLASPEALAAKQAVEAGETEVRSSPKCWCKLNSANLSFHKLKHTGFF